MIKAIIRFFDRLEDKIRSGLSHYPILYALIGGTGVILFWRGIWHTADLFSIMTGPLSLLIGIIVLLLTGVLVSSFVGNRLIMSGLKGEKKFAEKTKEEIENEETELKHVEKILNKIEGQIEHLDNEIHHQEKR